MMTKEDQAYIHDYTESILNSHEEKGNRYGRIGLVILALDNLFLIYLMYKLLG